VWALPPWERSRHEDHFFELAGTLLDLVAHEKIRVFYAEIPARFGIINPDATDGTAPPSVEKAP